MGRKALSILIMDIVALIMTTVIVNAETYSEYTFHSSSVVEIEYFNQSWCSEGVIITDKSIIDHLLYFMTSFNAEQIIGDMTAADDINYHWFEIWYEDDQRDFIRFWKRGDITFMTFSGIKNYQVQNEEFDILVDLIREIKSDRLRAEAISFKQTKIDNIEELVSNGLIAKWQCVDYEYNINRITLCQMIDYYLDHLNIKKSDKNDSFMKSFFDTTNYGFMKHLQALGIIDGKDDNWFYPYDNITREELAKILSKTYHCIADNIQYQNNNQEFKDGANISDWAVEYVKEITSMGLLEANENNEFMPQDYITKEDFIILLLKLNNRL